MPQSSFLNRLGNRIAPLVVRAAPARRAVGRAIAPITSLGWTVVGVGVVAWFVGARFGWDEVLVLAGACLVLVITALIMTTGRLGLDIDVDVTQPRVVEGGDVTGGIEVRNPRSRPVIGGRVEVPVGTGVVGFDVGALGGEQTFEDTFIIDTSRRAVVLIGPARAVKGDPLGIARREVPSGEVRELFVHPVTTRLPSFSAGWLRDLEGQTTNDLSTSDVAFHTLREYVPGDDRRHIHWRTTARLGTMMVRQFVDTRRSQLGLLLATSASDWADPDEFELGIRVLGSLGRTGLLDGQEVAAVVAGHALRAETPPLLLDGLAGVDFDGDLAIAALVRRSVRHLSNASIVAVVTGSTVEAPELRRACEQLGKDVTVLAIRCRAGAEASRQRIGNISMIELGALDGLVRMLGVVGAAA